VKHVAVLAAALLVLGARTDHAPQAEPIRRPGAGAPPGRSTVPWTVGERLEYQVKFDFFNVGRGTLQVVGIDTIRGEPCYHVLFILHGHAIFYTLDDSLQSWFGVNDLVSRRFSQDSRENGHPRSRSYEIFPERGIWIKDGTDTAETVAEPLDDASFFFFARTLPFEANQTYTLPRYFIADRNPVTMQVLARQSIRVPAGRFDAVAVHPIFKSRGMFSEGGEAVIWFSDDSLRLPLRIRTSMVVGTLEISLRSRN
jgi:Protein of unknown function (DUF3108)